MHQAEGGADYFAISPRSHVPAVQGALRAEGLQK